MSLAPADLRRGEWVYLMDLTIGSVVHRFAELPVEGVPFGPLSASVDYVGGLDVGGGVGREIDLFEDVPSSRSLNATLDVTARMDVPAMVFAGHTFLGADVRVYLHPVGSTSREAVFAGTVTAFEFQTKDDPVSLTASADIGEDVGTVHGSNDKLSAMAAVIDEEQRSTWLPVVFGAPGNGSASATPELHAYGAPAFGVVAATIYQVAICPQMTAAGVAADNVFFWNKTKDYSGLIACSMETTLRGDTATFATVAAFGPPEWETGDEIWIDWAASSGGILHPDGSTIRGAGDVLYWMASRAQGVVVDLPRIASIAPTLNRFKVDAAVWGADGEHVGPLAWVNEYLLPMLPVSAVMGPGGLYYSVWDPDATAHDAVATLDTGAGGNAYRMSDVESSDLSDIANDIVVRYGFDAKSGKPTKERRIVGDPSVIIYSGTNTRRGLWASRSAHRFGGRPGKAVDLPAVWDDATADMAASWLERRWSLPTYAVSYECPPSMAFLRPGDVVTVTDRGLALSGRVALVTVATPERSGSVKVRVRIYEGG